MVLFSSQKSEYEKKCELALRIFNKFADATGIRKARALNAPRRASLSALLNMSGPDIRLYIRNLYKSVDFFKDKPQIYYFEWFFKPTSIVNIMEGKYTVRYKHGANIPEVQSQIKHDKETW